MKKHFLWLVILAGVSGSATAQDVNKPVLGTRESQTSAAPQTSPTQDKKDALKPRISPETENKAFELLEDIYADTAQLKSPLLRAEIRYRLAELLWIKDQKRAREMYQSAIDEARNLLSKSSVSPTETEPDTFYEESTENEYELSRLREQLILSVGENDPKMALDALASLSVPNNKVEEYNPLNNENELALTLSAKISAKDPQKAYDLIKKGLEKGFPANFMTVVGDLQKNSPELAGKLATEIYEKIRSLPVSPTATEANGEKPPAEEINMWQLSEFLNIVTKSHDPKSVKDGEKVQPLLSDADTRELAALIARRIGQESESLTYQLASSYDSLQKFAPAQAATLKKRLKPAEIETFNTIIQNQRNYTPDMTLEDSIKAAENSPAAERDGRYANAAYQAIEQEDFEKAQELYAKINKKDDYEYIAEALKRSLPTANAAKGDVGETRKAINEINSTSEKIRALASLSNTLYAASRVKDAEQIASEVANLMPTDTRRQVRLQAVFDIARAYAPLNDEKSFGLLEGSLGQVNDLINAAALVEEFTGGYWMRYEEFKLDAMERSRVATLYDGTNLLLMLAEKDFERTVGLAQKLSRPDVRVYAKYVLATSLLDASAALNERQRRREYEQEGEH